MAAFWLRPAAEERDFFVALIERLARDFDAPMFEPHVTLFAGRMDERRALEILHQLPSAPPVPLEVESVAFSSEFTKTLFVQFRASARSERAGRGNRRRSRVARRLRFRSAFEFALSPDGARDAGGIGRQDLSPEAGGDV